VQKNSGISTSYFALQPPAYVFEDVEQAYKIFFIVPLHIPPKITMQIKGTTVVNHQSIRKQTKTTLPPLPHHLYGSGPSTCRRTATVPHSVRKDNAKPEASTRLQRKR